MKNELKQKYLPSVAEGNKFAAFGLTEANAGSDASGIQTTAVLDGGLANVDAGTAATAGTATASAFGALIVGYIWHHFGEIHAIEFSAFGLILPEYDIGMFGFVL